MWQMFGCSLGGLSLLILPARQPRSCVTVIPTTSTPWVLVMWSLNGSVCPSSVPSGVAYTTASFNDQVGVPPCYWNIIIVVRSLNGGICMAAGVLGLNPTVPLIFSATPVICVNPINNWGNLQLLDYQIPSCDYDLQKFSRILWSWLTVL